MPKDGRQKCGMCGGSGTVPIDPSDRRKGEKTCWQCNGSGRR